MLFEASTGFIASLLVDKFLSAFSKSGTFWQLCENEQPLEIMLQIFGQLFAIFLAICGQARSKLQFACDQ